MKTSLLLQLATLSTAFVIPDGQVSNLEHVEIQRHPKPAQSVSSFLNKVESAIGVLAEELKDTAHDASGQIEKLEHESKHVLDDAVAYVKDVGVDMSDKIYDTYFDAQGWLDAALEKEIDMEEFDLFNHPPCHDDDPSHDHPPHDGPHHDHPPHHEHPPHDGPHHPHHPPHHHKPNMTVYQLIASSKYTTKLAKLIDEYDDLVDALNSTKSANYTIFAPTDRAFEKIPEHAPKPSKEQLKKLLTYHVSPEFYPAGRILVSRTIPTLLKSDHLGKEPLPQRLSTNIGPRGLTVNFYSRIVAVDIFGTNGVIHGVDSIILPPPRILKIIDLLPSEFSTLELGLTKTGLFEKLNTTDHAGGTFFAPSNFAFQKLGPRINAFLFSSHGLKYLKALLQYHVVPEHTLYSDAYYAAHSGDDDAMVLSRRIKTRDDPHHGPPKGLFHVDLPTMLEDRHLSIDIARYGRLIDIKINGFARVVVSDGVAEDGVLHVVSDVLIPPKQLPGTTDAETELTVDELKSRLEPFVEHEDEWTDL